MSLMKSSRMMKEGDFSFSTLWKITVFNAMFNLQLKGKKNVEKIDLLVANSNQVLQKQKEDSAEIRRFPSEKYQIKKKIDNLLQKIYTE